MAKLFAQDRQVQGIVFDKDTKQRLVRVYIYNLSTHKGFYNNGKGEFSTTASKGDTLIAALQGYRVDTITVQNSQTLLFYLKRLNILLDVVTVKDTIKSAKSIYDENRDANKDIYRKGDAGDLLRVGSGANGVGAGLSIDALWSLLSREGKNARFLQKILERDYHDMIVNYRYSKKLVTSITGLQGDKLTDFMQQYRPSYYFALDANDYSLISFIKEAYKTYQRDPTANRLPPLKSNNKN